MLSCFLLRCCNQFLVQELRHVKIKQHSKPTPRCVHRARIKLMLLPESYLFLLAHCQGCIELTRQSVCVCVCVTMAKKFTFQDIFGLTCVCVIVAAFPAAQITIGAVYLHECPASPGIPMYVIGCGVLALLLMALLVLPKILCPAALDKVWTVCTIILVLFILIWFFYGSYQIYSVYPPNYEKNITDPDRNSSNFFSSSEPGNLAPTLDNQNQSLLNPNQNQSLLNLNQTQMIENKQTLKRLIEASALTNISSEHLKAPQAQQVSSAVTYCDKTLYLLSFWTTTLIYALAAHALLISICIYGCMAVANLLTKYTF